MMTNQALFNKVVRHLRRQGERSVGPTARWWQQCMYRGPNGLKCAIGCLIPDEKYRKSIEKHVVGYHGPIREAAGISDDPIQISLAWTLQDAHDSYNPIMWESIFRKIARRYNLRLQKRGRK